MLILAFCWQVVVDSAYSSNALRTLVTRAAAGNRNVPEAVRGYTASVESEVAIVVHQAPGTEAPVSLEQLSSRVQWRWPGSFEQHVIGDRLEAAGPQLTALSFLQQSPLVPHLYGNRIQLLFGRDSSIRRIDQARPGRQTVAVHPLSEDRDRTYRFSGGDTVVTMHIGQRSISVVRVQVQPRDDLPSGTVVFTGEMFLDVTRGHLVRLRGRFSSTGESASLPVRALRATLQSALYVELDNLEVERQVWLPVSQRFEAQIHFRISSDTRSIFRVVSTFRDHQLRSDSASPNLSGDTLEAHPHRLTIAAGDSLGRFTDWARALGAATAGERAGDFDDVASDAWRPSGAPIVRIQASRLSQLVHINRIEGWYTGIAAEFAARDAAPGLRVLAHAGWAWHEQTIRGQASTIWDRGPNRFGVHLGRTLDMTNDFRAPLDSGSTLGAAFGVDDYDYVARNLVGLTWRREWGPGRLVVTGVELARVHDGMASVHLRRSPFRLGQEYRDNRGVTTGSYTRSILALDLNPAVALGFVQPGVGAHAELQRGDGSLQYQRIEARGVARWNGKRVTAALRLDAGQLDGRRIPAQQLFELGAAQNLLGYGYKEFAGNRALAVRGLAMQRIPVLRAPWRLRPRFILPAPAPAFALSVQAAWVGSHGSAVNRALADLASVPIVPGNGDGCDTDAVRHDSISRPTCGWRSSVGVGLRFFGGTLGVDLARPVDTHGRWRLRFNIGQIL